MDSEPTMNETTLTAGLIEEENEDNRYPLVSVMVTLGCLVVGVGLVFLIFRVFCKSRSKHEGSDYVKGKHGFFDQFDVNNSQLNIRDEERFVNEGASFKASGSESSTESNTDNTTGESGGGSGIAGMLIKSVHGQPATRFTVNKVKSDKSARSSARSSAASLTIKVPKDFFDRCTPQYTESVGAPRGDMKQYSLALIDKRSNTIHNIDLNNASIGEGSFAGATNSVLLANRWREKSRKRQRRPVSSASDSRRKSVQSSPLSGCNSESLSSHSEESIPHVACEMSEVSAQHLQLLTSIDESHRYTEESDTHA